MSSHNFFKDDDHDDDVDEASVHCVTCGADVHSKTAIRHMERCYNKVRLYNKMSCS